MTHFVDGICIVDYDGWSLSFPCSCEEREERRKVAEELRKLMQPMADRCGPVLLPRAPDSVKG
jgi:hypothetical protein